MNWVIVTSMTLQLLNPAQLGIALQAETDSATAQVQAFNLSTSEENPEPPQIPYTIDTNEIQGGSEINSWLGSVDVSTSSTVPAVNAVVEYRLKDAQGDFLAHDLYLPGVKENVVFNAANTIRALAFLDTRLIRWPETERRELYQRFDQDPIFGIIEETLRNAKRMPEDFQPVLDQIKQLTQDTAERYARETGRLPKSK